MHIINIVLAFLQKSVAPTLEQRSEAWNVGKVDANHLQKEYGTIIKLGELAAIWVLKSWREVRRQKMEATLAPELAVDETGLRCSLDVSRRDARLGWMHCN